MFGNFSLPATADYLFLAGPQLIAPVALVSPIRQPTTAIPTQPIFVSPADSPITPSSSIGSAPAMNSFMQSPNIDYNVLMKLVAFRLKMRLSFLNGRRGRLEVEEGCSESRL